MNFVGGALKLKGSTKPVTVVSSKSKDIKKDKKDKKDKNDIKKEERKENRTKPLISEEPLQEKKKPVEDYLTPAQK